MGDLGWKREVRLWTDSAAAKAIASRSGLGRTRHVETKFLWIQAAVKEGRLNLVKVHGKSNPADWLTKPGSAGSRALEMEEWGLELQKRREEEQSPPKRRSWADLLEEEEEERRAHSSE